MASASPWTLRATGAPGGMVADEGELRRGLSLLADPDGWCQVVGLPGAKAVTLAGGDLDGLCAAVEGMPSGFGVYLEVNPVREGLTSKAKAADVVKRRWLFIDVDPLKAEGFEKEAATDAEKGAALEGAQVVFEHLQSSGWPLPAVVDSGNGWYLLYRVDLPNDEESRRLIRSTLYHLATLVADKPCSFDKSVHNADRLAKVPGTWARKGGGTHPDRPHRPCRLHAVPASLDVVTADMLRAAVPAKDEPPRPKVEPWKLRASQGRVGRRAYALGGLDKERIKLALTPPGDRDNQLYRSGAALGELVGAGELSDAEVFDALSGAARANGLLADIGEAEVLDKLRRSIEKGKANPRQIPERNGKHETAGPPDPNALLTVNLATVEPQRVDWLVPGRVPRGFITVFAGRTSVGKSFVAYDLIARLSKGGEIPGADGEAFAPGGALIVGEDPPEFVIVPRLIAAGADRSRVHCMTWEAMGAFDLRNVDMLDRAAGEVKGGASVVLIDPPTNFLRDADEHKNSEVRQIVMKVVEWALRRDLAVIFILHVNKQTGKGVEALNRVMGSVAWVTTARIAHSFCPDPDDRERCLWAPLKNNLGKLPKALAYQIVQTGEATAGQAVIEWGGEVDTTADEAMNSTPRVRRDVAAADWLVGKFRERREWESEELFKAARAENVSRNAIFEAKKALNLPKARKQTQENGDSTWLWWVPSDWPPLTSGTVGTVETLDGK